MALIFSSHRILAWVRAKGSDDAMQLAEVSGILMIGSPYAGSDDHPAGARLPVRIRAAALPPSISVLLISICARHVPAS
jgi:hypothetical protein